MIPRTPGLRNAAPARIGTAARSFFDAAGREDPMSNGQVIATVIIDALPIGNPPSHDPLPW
jgi:hypothetical protein